MQYAIVLFFDPASCRRIDGLRNGLFRAAGTAAPGTGTPRPHISLAVLETLDDAEPVKRILRKFSQAVFPFEINFDSVGWFPTNEKIMFLGPATTRRLLEVHEEMHSLLTGVGLISIPYYRPGQWTPHCTLCGGLPPDAAIRALEAALRSDVFGRVTLTEIGLVEFYPIKYLDSYPLTGNRPAE